MKITAKMLRDVYACEAGVKRACELFPELNREGVEVTLKNLETARSIGADIYIFLSKLLPRQYRNISDHDALVEAFKDGAVDTGPTPHPHAALMMEYVKEAAIDQDVWKNWEYYSNTYGGWVPLIGSPMWSTNDKYRRRPAPKRFIGGIEVPRAETVAPAVGTEYYAPTVSYGEAFAADIDWDDDLIDLRLLNNKMVYLSSDDAMAHAEALIQLSKESQV